MPRSPPARSGSGSGKRSAPKLATPSSSEDAGAAARAGQASLRPGALVWVTRTQPAADATAQRVRALGFSALVAPLLEVRAVADAVVDLTDVSAIAFTSGNAVAAFGALSAERGLRVFAVGEATAAAARAIGFRIVLSAQGDVRALAAALRARRRELIGPILYPAAAEPAQDLPGALGAAGLSTRTVIVYETAEAPPSASLIAHLPEIAGVLVHSAKAAGALAALLEEHPAPHLIAYCLSPQAARPLARAGLAATLCAPAPNETALLALLTRSASD